ncbi:Serine/threonine-protein kinase TIO [Bienertia sinuspersici]
MISFKALAICLVRKGMLEAARMRRLLRVQLKRLISELTNLLLSTEDDVTKSNAAGALSNLVRHSNKLCDNIMSKGAIQVSCHLSIGMSPNSFIPPQISLKNKHTWYIYSFELVRSIDLGKEDTLYTA